MEEQSPSSAAKSASRPNRIPLRESRLKRARKAATMLLLTGFPGLLFYAYLHFSETGRFPALEKNMPGFIVALVIGLICGLALYAFNKALDRWLSWIDYYTSRFLLGFLADVIIAMTVIVSLSTLAIKLWGNDIFWPSTTAEDPDVKWKIAILSVVFIFIYNVIYALLYAYQYYAVAQLGRLKRERKQLELQFE